MPKKIGQVTDYQKTMMYKIVCDDVEVKDVYVGQTTNFVKRNGSHSNLARRAYKLKHESLLYQTIRKHGGWYNWSMIKIEDYPCDSRLEAEKRERYWIETLNANLNKVLCNLEEDEYVDCECGVKLKKSNLKNHKEMTTVHKKWVKDNDAVE